MLSSSIKQVLAGYHTQYSSASGCIVLTAEFKLRNVTQNEVEYLEFTLNIFIFYLLD